MLGKAQRKEIEAITLNLEASIESAREAARQIEQGEADCVQAECYLSTLLNAVINANNRLKKLL